MRRDNLLLCAVAGIYPCAASLRLTLRREGLGSADVCHLVLLCRSTFRMPGLVDLLCLALPCLPAL